MFGRSALLGARVLALALQIPMLSSTVQDLEPDLWSVREGMHAFDLAWPLVLDSSTLQDFEICPQLRAHEHMVRSLALASSGDLYIGRSIAFSLKKAF